MKSAALLQLGAQMPEYRPDPKILELGDAFYDPVEPARFPKAVPRFLNRQGR